MALLTREAEERIVNLLLSEGLADVNLVTNIKAQADAAGKQVLAELRAQKLISDDMVARATAAIIGTTTELPNCLYA